MTDLVTLNLIGKAPATSVEIVDLDGNVIAHLRQGADGAFRGDVPDWAVRIGARVRITYSHDRISSPYFINDAVIHGPGHK